MANPNLVTANTIQGKVVSGQINGNQPTVLSCPSGHVYKINSITFSGEDLTDQTSVRMRIRQGNSVLCMMYDFVDIPAQTTFVGLSSDTPIYLTEFRNITFRNGGQQLNYVIHYEDIS